MIYLSATYSNRPILSLRVGGPIGHASSPVINANNLKIEGWYATMQGEQGQMILPSGQVRDIISKGIVVDDHDAITPIEDLIRLKDVIDLGYKLIGVDVYSESGAKLGKVQEYSVDQKSLYINKLYVAQGLLRSIANFGGSQLIINRSQIVDITSTKIIVSEATQKAKSPTTATAQA